MTAEALLAAFERMARENWAYETGAAREGCVDCSGAFVWSFAQAGQNIPHGSNAIARKNMDKVRGIGEARPGWAAFKWKEEGEPAQYLADGLGNFYHIGLISRDGKHVLNAKNERWGFCMDKITDGWTDCCPLAGVTYGAEEGKGMDLARVTTEKDPLRVRERPESGRVIGHVPKGETVEVLLWSDWPRIRWGELVGYACGQYLTRVAAAQGETAQAASGGWRIIDDAGNVFVPQGGWRVTC